MKKQTIAGRLERIPWTSFHTKLLVLLAIGEFFDLYDLFAGGFVVTQVAKYYGISIPTSVFYTVAISFLGAFVGVIVLNLIADSIGRRTATCL